MNHSILNAARRAALALTLTIGTELSLSSARAELKPKTVTAWNQYVSWADEKTDRELASSDRFLIMDHLPPRQKARVRREVDAGEVTVRRASGVVPNKTKFKLPDGQIHHWWGSVLIPDVSLEQVIAFVQDYDNHADRFLEISNSRLIAQDDQVFRFSFRIKRTKSVVTVHYNTEQTCHYQFHGPTRASSRSEATKIAELEHPNTSREKELTDQQDRGFLWRLISWWRFEATDKGVIVECESVTLSRKIPFFFRMVPGLNAYLTSVARESLENTLSSIREHAPKFQPAK